jgi:hypothetical protein
MYKLLLAQLSKLTISANFNSASLHFRFIHELLRLTSPQFSTKQYKNLPINHDRSQKSYSFLVEFLSEISFQDFFPRSLAKYMYANIMLQDVQLQMIAVLEALGYDGWISRHDRSDPRVEICLFRPSLCLREEECVVLGPQTDSL